MCVCTRAFARMRAQSFSCVWVFAVLWAVARQAPLSVGFSRQEYWSGLPFPPPQDLPDPGIEPISPALAGGFFFFCNCATWEAHPYAHICTNKTNYLWAKNIPCYDTVLGKIPWKRAWKSTPVFLPGESYGQGSLVGYMGSQGVGHDWSDLQVWY